MALVWSGETEWRTSSIFEEEFDGTGWAPASGPVDLSSAPQDISLFTYSEIGAENLRTNGGFLEPALYESTPLYLGPSQIIVGESYDGGLLDFVEDAWSNLSMSEMWAHSRYPALTGVDTWTEFIELNPIYTEEMFRPSLVSDVSNKHVTSWESSHWVYIPNSSVSSRIMSISNRDVIARFSAPSSMVLQIIGQDDEILATSSPFSDPEILISFDSVSNEMHITHFENPIPIEQNSSVSITPGASYDYAQTSPRPKLILHKLDGITYRYKYKAPVLADNGNGGDGGSGSEGSESNSNGGVGGLGGSVFGVSWNQTSDRLYETGLDRGVLYLSGVRAYSTTMANINLGGITSTVSEPLNEQGATVLTFLIDPFMEAPFPVGSRLRAAYDPDNYLEGEVTSSTVESVTIVVDIAVGTGTYSNWTLIQPPKAVPWNGLISVDETGSESAVEYYMDGRPYFHYTNPKEYTANIRAYTYPDEFAKVMGLHEATDGVYLDSQLFDTFALSYRTLIGSAVEGGRKNYKIHIIYNASVAVEGMSYETLAADINPSTFSWAINAVPVSVEGYRPTAHVIIDTRKLTVEQVKTIEEQLYGTPTTPATLPNPQDIFDLLKYADGVVITLLDDDYWTAEGPNSLVYKESDDVFTLRTDAENFGTHYELETTN